MADGRLKIGSDFLKIGSYYLRIGPAVSVDSLSYVTSGGSTFGSPTLVTFGYTTPDNGGNPVELYLFFYMQPDPTPALAWSDGAVSLLSQDQIDNVNGSLVRAVFSAPDNSAGETITISGGNASSRIAYILIAKINGTADLEDTYNDSTLVSSAATDLGAVPDPGFVLSVIGLPFGILSSSDFWTVAEADAILLGEGEGGGASGNGVRAYWWKTSLPQTQSWSSPTADVNRPLIWSMSFTT